MDGLLDNIPVAFTVLARLGACAVYLPIIIKKNISRKRVTLLVIVLLVQLVQIAYGGFFYEIIRSGTMLVSFGLAVGLCLCVNSRDWKLACFYGTKIFLVTELFASVAWNAVVMMGPSFYKQPQEKIVAVGIITVLSVISYLAERAVSLNRIDATLKQGECLLVMIIGVVTFFMSGWKIQYSATEVAGEYGLLLFELRTFIDFVGVLLVFAIGSIIYGYQNAMNLQMMKSTMEKQASQYRVSEECVNLLNYKYHDMKHQLLLWKQENVAERSGALLNDLEELIEQYDIKANTGHKVLDVILTEKRMMCRNKHIQLTAVVDGQLFSFMKEEDLCSIFGNALDNAIEHEEKIADESKRLIHVTVKRVHDTVVAVVENYTEEADGDTVHLNTSKANKHLHGYGLKSIRYTVEKYDGVFSTEWNNHWFFLRMAFPIS